MDRKKRQPGMMRLRITDCMIVSMDIRRAMRNADTVGTLLLSDGVRTIRFQDYENMSRALIAIDSNDSNDGSTCDISKYGAVPVADWK